MTPTKKILIVDDSISSGEAMRQMLAGDYVVKNVSNGADALAVLTRFRPDLVLLDVEMPGMDGYQVCREIRSLDRNGFVKIIMVSAKTALEERLMGYEAGADDYIRKPFMPEELIAKIRVFIRIQSLEDELHQLNEKLNQQVQIRTSQLINAEKMAAIGQYAAGVVHNLNSPLQAVLSMAELFTYKYPDNTDTKILVSAALDMKKIVKTILNGVHKDNKMDYENIDLNEVIKAQIRLLKSNLFFKHNIRLELNLKPLPPRRGIYSHFSQSLGNLIKNAVEAMYETPERVLTIESRTGEDGICIAISDTGHGIPQDKLGAIFNPFYTTKPLSAEGDRPTGTGLGLSSAKEMIESYGGKIEVTSAVGKGTTFTVQL
jgi:signal transduction histidine kinase